MSSIRSTTSPAPTYDAHDRPQVRSRPAVRPVHLEREIEPDRRRSLREELDAAEEHLPEDEPASAEADAHRIAEALEQLGADALHLLQPVSAKVARLLEPEHIDEQA